MLLSWLLVPVAAVLVQSALSFPRPFSGLVLRRDWVAAVVPGSPGERAGFKAGDRVAIPQAEQGRRRSIHGNIAEAPGRPLTLERVRGSERRLAWLVPESLPIAERRMLAAQLAVAAVFVLLGGWVWSERRDPLTATFFLICLSFAWLLAPQRQWRGLPLEVVDDVIVAGIQLYLPALCVHFFALFPESRPRGPRGGWVNAAYAVASLLFVPTVAIIALAALGREPSPVVSELIQAVSALWFAIGLLAALGLFAASYAQAGGSDARRRLRVALVGSALGAGPLAGLIAVRNLSPGTAIPGERWAIALTLLVPASFAWAIAVHRIFDFRVALRAGAVTALLAAAGGASYAVGEWLAATWWPDLSAGISGGTLAFVALAASLAGPAAPWLGALGARVIPGESEAPLAGRLADVPVETSTNGGSRDGAVEQLLAQACEAVTRYLRLSGCIALIVDNGHVRPVAGTTPLPEPGPELRLRTGELSRSGVCSVDAAPLETADREALEIAGVGWLLPIGGDPVRVVLLLGRRLAGAWLSRREIFELERFGEHVSIALEIATLRREASSHGALERELKEAGAIQAHLLPRHAPVYPTLDCAAAALSSEPVGGDYFDFVEGPGRAFTLAVGDAAGKGVPAALLLAQVQARFRNQARHGLTPGELLGVLNQELVGLDQPEKFVGLLCARVEVRSARVWIANAGLTPPLVMRAAGSFQEILSGGVLLGVSAGATYPDACVELNAGDMVVVYTDGLTEARRGEELFGPERVKEVLDRIGSRRAADVLEELLSAVREFADRPLDDLTVVVLKQLTNPARVHPAPPQNALKWPADAADREIRGDRKPPSPVRAANPRTAESDG